MLLSVTLIVKNEAAVLGRCLATICEVADEIIIVDTGSTDDTKAVARRYTDSIYDFTWCDDFAAARQFAFDRAHGDWMMWLDADDVVAHADRLVPLLNAAPIETGGFQFRYIYALDERGNPISDMWRERCVRNDGTFHWVAPVHEVLVSSIPRTLQRETEVFVIHAPDPVRAAAKQGRNLHILQAAYAASGDAFDPRLLFYLGREYSDNGDYSRAIATLEQYLGVSGWEDERYIAQTQIAHLHRILEHYEAAIDADLHALKIHPHWPEAYFGLAETYYYLKEWSKVVHWCDVGRSLPPPDTILFVNPATHEYDWIIYYTNALQRVGRLADALAWTERALERDPQNIWHQHNHTLFVQQTRGET